MTGADTASGAVGLRARLGEWCFRTGLLRPLQWGRNCYRGDLRILAYHRVLSVADPAAFEFDLELISTSAERFEEQMRWIKRRFVPVRLGEVVAAIDSGRPLPAHAVAVTFDDGYDDNYRVAFPILRDLGVPATFFVSTGHIDSGRPFAYDWLVYMVLHTRAGHLSLPSLGLDRAMPACRSARRTLASEVLTRLKELDDPAQSALIAQLEVDWAMPREHAPSHSRPMNWDQLREMQAAGFEIGSHGVDHRMLAKLGDDELQRELHASKAALDRELGGSATLLSYPVGGDRAFNAKVIAASRHAGYGLACSYICGSNHPATMERYALRRLPVERMMGLGWFAAMLTLPELMSYPTASRNRNSEQATACFP